MNPMTNDGCVADMKDAISEAKSIYEESKAPELTPDEELWARRPLQLWLSPIAFKPASSPGITSPEPRGRADD